MGVVRKSIGQACKVRDYNNSFKLIAEIKRTTKK